MTHRTRTIRQRQLFDSNGPTHVLEGDRKTELLALLAQLIREAERTQSLSGLVSAGGEQPGGP